MRLTVVTGTTSLRAPDAERRNAVIYLDHAATTPLRASALAAFAAASAHAGNPSSVHGSGQQARRRLEDARSALAGVLGCEPVEVILTAGGTEAINLGIKGLFWQRRAEDPARLRILVAEGEHQATLDSASWLDEHEGARIDWLPLEEEGTLRPETLAAALAEDPGSVALVTVLWVNNEIGTINPIEELAAVCAVAGVPLHVDAVAALGHLPLRIAEVRRASESRDGAGLVAVSVSGHKVGGPIATGALVLARDARMVPVVHGGGQQRGVRSGTQDVPGAAAFAAAAVEADAELSAEAVRLAALRDRLVAGILAAVPGATLTGPALDSGRRVANNAHLAFPGAQGDSLLFLLDTAGVSVSTGSACTAGIPEPSHVVLALGRSEDEARGVLRMTLGYTSTDADVDALLAALPDAYARAARAGLSNRAVLPA
ncbi:cysteine desulfurase [Rathayibacter rathayi]|uniref:Cysteine desulfurase n=1 Tax=Rathayibacter rathayi TaxID=33887 RepID=A0ABX5ABR9_RATRA|nr:cysteine desulfurase [Rathayibacter rathayi]MWV74006.1 aminotransferase class V-fold PLP-dependent enzyme [Rathayibacter rathayi NCPPB 2980 = VKM Ac-1601]PPF49490.1 cysteine desulfurase [Rathayibacter rathayi]PPF80207.1 cysteine desulfurase [Rathayibacter rathayi]PPG09945.1 cysteine desulfurase [Rathayibacter rathayi]